MSSKLSLCMECYLEYEGTTLYNCKYILMCTGEGHLLIVDKYIYCCFGELCSSFIIPFIKNVNNKMYLSRMLRKVLILIIIDVIEQDKSLFQI